MTGLQAVVEDHWRTLAVAQPHPDSLAVSRLPVSVAAGDLVLGVDGRGRRHLLVPVEDGHDIVADTRSAGVHVVPRRLVDAGVERVFADLVLVDAGRVDVFSSLCADVLAAVAVEPDRPVRALRGVVDAWRALFDAAGPALGPAAVAGLFAELVILSRMLAIDPGATAAWTGPFGAAQDFHRAGRALEVKATTDAERRTFRAHGVDQLATDDHSLILAWLRLERSARRGRTLAELANDVRAAADDERAVVLGLTAAGFSAADTYVMTVRFTVVEERWYDVTSSFPRLVPSSFVGGVEPDGIRDIAYTVDLDRVDTWLDDGGKYLGEFLGGR